MGIAFLLHFRKEEKSLSGNVNVKGLGGRARSQEFYCRSAKLAAERGFGLGCLKVPLISSRLSALMSFLG